MIPPAADIARLSREFAALGDSSGGVLWADERAERRIRAASGGPLTDLCVPATTAKAQELTRKGSAGDGTGWEISLVVDGQQVAMEQMDSATANVARLAGEAARQQHGISRDAAELEDASRNPQESRRAGARERLTRDTGRVISKQNLSRELDSNRIRDALGKGELEIRR
ncbi:MAG TPA: hypothetical protein VFJ02_05695 [Vicinamibacterales bacterium]|nr:hypothetical protein [Vicinamibacterales bacterium]